MNKLIFNEIVTNIHQLEEIVLKCTLISKEIQQRCDNIVSLTNQCVNNDKE